MSGTKDAHELRKENLRDEQGAWKDRAPDGQLLIHDAITTQRRSPGSPPRSKLRNLYMQI